MTPIDPSIAENAIKELVQSSIQTALKKYNNNLKKMINKRMKGRVGKKSLTIPKDKLHLDKTIGYSRN